MQSASSNFSQAMSGFSGTWAPPQVHADWGNNGYGGDTSIDNLSSLEGPITVHQALDDGMPSDVTYTSGSDSTSSASFPAGGSGSMKPNQYWSLDNGSSPISGYERDVAAMTIAAGAVTAGGIERVTVFTGQMSDAAITGQDVAVSAVSAARLKLTKRIQPPPIKAIDMGLTATWPVSYSLSKCGLYASPPPRSGCRFWDPMHGSMKPMIPDTTKSLGNLGFSIGQQDLHNPDLPNVTPTFVAGPFVTGVYATVDATHGLLAEMHVLPLAPGTDLVSQAASAGRVEMWIRGDVADYNPAWMGGVPFVNSLLHFTITNGNGTYAEVGVAGPTRKPYVEVFDGTHTVRLTSPTAIPSDGAWYPIGGAWDFAGKKLWTLSNSTATATGAPTLTTSGLPATDDISDVTDPFPAGVEFECWLPSAELQVTSGTQANPDNFPWVNDSAYWSTAVAGAIIRPSILPLVALAEPVPREAADIIASYAQAELAMTRTDELDRFCYLPLPYWVETAQQTVAETISTSTNAGTDLAITRDLTKIRNQIQVNYSDTRINNPLAAFLGDALISFTVYTLPPGVTTIPLTFTGPAVNILDGDLDGALYLITAADITAGVGPNETFICANSARDGSGSFATSAQIVATIPAWTAGGATLVVTNSSATTYYTANTGVVPYIDIKGSIVVTADASATVQDDANIAARGVRGLTADLPTLQDATTANFIAAELLARQRKAKREVTVTVRGDPRRQPGDLVRLQDPTGTAINGVWRSLTVDHSISGGDYTQSLQLIEAGLIGVWDQSTWDDGSVWGP